jgi:hypothetical protein
MSSLASFLPIESEQMVPRQGFGVNETRLDAHEFQEVFENCRN